jgi:hypothetical protein
MSPLGLANEIIERFAGKPRMLLLAGACFAERSDDPQWQAGLERITAYVKALSEPKEKS